MSKPIRKFLYLHGEKSVPIIVHARSRPSEKSIPLRGTWVVKEFSADGWFMPCFPEITWGTLKNQKFIGEWKP